MDAIMSTKIPFIMEVSKHLQQVQEILQFMDVKNQLEHHHAKIILVIQQLESVPLIQVLVCA
jgi:hypothetical protein